MVAFVEAFGVFLKVIIILFSAADAELRRKPYGDY